MSLRNHVQKYYVFSSQVMSMHLVCQQHTSHVYILTNIIEMLIMQVQISEIYATNQTGWKMGGG